MDLNGFDLNLVVSFDALMAERNVTRAGRRIGRTQPPMSAALARLRALFARRPTPDGLQSTQRVAELAEPLGRALAEIGRTLEFTQSFTPALSDHPAFMLLPALVELLRTRTIGDTPHQRLHPSG